MESGVPLPMMQGQHALAAIVFTNGVDFSVRMAADKDYTLDLLRRNLQIMRELCQRFEGQVLKFTGHGLLMYFVSAVQAVRCAIEIQKALAEVTINTPPSQVLVHQIGIHLGDVFFSETYVTGNGVNIAALLQAEAEPGGICLSQTVYDVVKTALNLEATYLGPLNLTNITEAVPAYQILPASQTPRTDAAVLEEEIGQGTRLNNRYRIQRILGRGGFGRTYLASDDQRFGELCVLKEFVPSSRAEYTVQKSRALFEREAKVLYQINHPQIPKFLAWFAQTERLFIVQEYIDGKTYSNLLQELKQQGQLFSEASVIQWLKDLLPVLTYLHERNLVHRDISPDNVMLPNYQSLPMLIDFGLVKQTVTTQFWAVNPDSSSGCAQSFVGKFGYAPPEQIRMGQCYACSDLYALGVTAVVLLTGIEPNLLMDHKTLEWQWHDKVKVSDQLGRILDKMLKEKPTDRYQSAPEVQASLHALASQSVIALSQPPMELHIEIDSARLDRQVAEIVEMDYFQQLQRQAESLRKSIQTDLVPQQSMLLAETAMSWPTGAVNPEIQQQATTLPKINPAFIDRCGQELALCIGPIAKYILEQTLAQNPDISPLQLVEALAAEISNPQKAQEFRKSVEIRPPEPPVLRLIHSSGREFRLQGEESYIGRRGKSSIIVPKTVPKIDLTGIPHEGVVSRSHARIYWDKSQNAYILVDNNSLNGTYLNGNPLTPDVHYRLNHGDSLQLGQNNLVCFTVSVT